MRKVFMFAMMASAMFFTACNKPVAETEKVDGASTMPELSAIRVAGELAKYGQEVSSPLALIEAADILASTPTQEIEAVQTEVSQEVANDGEKNKIALEPAALLAMAKELSFEDEHLLALIAKVETKLNAEAEGTRGAFGGPKRGCYTVYANSTDRYEQKFIADQLAEIAVIGDGDTDLDIYVYDQNGNLIVMDEDYSGDCYVSWYPRWTGTYLLKIVNRGRVYNNYCIATN